MQKFHVHNLELAAPEALRIMEHGEPSHDGEARGRGFLEA